MGIVYKGSSMLHRHVSNEMKIERVYFDFGNLIMVST